MTEPITRRALLRAAAGVAAITPLLDLASPPASRLSDDRLTLGVPLTHSDWMLKPGMKWGADCVRHMLDACRACGWSRVYWRVLDGGRSLYPSKLLRPMGRWDDDSFWSPKDEKDRALARRFTAGMSDEQRAALLAKFDRLDYAHFDPLADAVRYGHQIGLQIHAWVAVNEDDHGWGLVSEFSRQHPQFRWRRRDGRYYRSQLSFAFPEVRAYKLAILEEVVRNYDVDGLFLDWIRTGDVRDNPQTDRAGVADSGYEQPLIDQFKAQYDLNPYDLANGDDWWVRLRAGPQTQFMRDVRRLARGSGRPAPLPVAVLVGHPWHYRGEPDPIDGNLRGLLLDLRAWADEALIDAAVAAGYYRPGGSPEAAYRALREETGGKVDVWSYGWVPQTVADFERDAAAAQRLGARELLLWEADYIDDRPNAAALKAAMWARSKR